jgi:hypothetical protein
MTDKLTLRATASSRESLHSSEALQEIVKAIRHAFENNDNKEKAEDSRLTLDNALSQYATPDCTAIIKQIRDCMPFAWRRISREFEYASSYQADFRMPGWLKTFQTLATIIVQESPQDSSVETLEEYMRLIDDIWKLEWQKSKGEEYNPLVWSQWVNTRLCGILNKKDVTKEELKLGWFLARKAETAINGIEDKEILEAEPNSLENNQKYFEARLIKQGIEIESLQEVMFEQYVRFSSED